MRIKIDGKHIESQLYEGGSDYVQTFLSVYTG